MHYYSFHVGDFRASTAHLSNAEELAYRRALDWYYSTESPLPLDTEWVARRLRVDVADLQVVLSDFFQRAESGWVLQRCQTEINRYQSLAERNRQNGRKGGRPKSGKKPSGFPVGCELKAVVIPLESQPRTNNQELTTKNQETAVAELPVPTNWWPSPEIITDLGMLCGFSADWVDQQVPSFVRYWNRRGEPLRNSPDALFYDHCRARSKMRGFQ